MKTIIPSIRKPDLWKGRTGVLPQQFQKNFRSSSVLNKTAYSTAKFHQSALSVNQQIPSKFNKEENDNLSSTSTFKSETLNNNLDNYDDLLFNSTRTTYSIKQPEVLDSARSYQPLKMRSKKIGTATLFQIEKPKDLSVDNISKMKALEQKNELLELLEFNNLSPMDILLKLSTYVTPYAKLFKLAYDELQYATSGGHSAQLDELERNSAVASAKQEIEVQQLMDKAVRLKAEGSDLKNVLKRHQNKLKKINNDIDFLYKIASAHGIEISDKTLTNNNPKHNTPVNINNDSILTTEKVIPLDDDLYKRLWHEHTNLLDEMEQLGIQLKKTQEKQIKVLHDNAVKYISEKRKIYS